MLVVLRKFENMVVQIDIAKDTPEEMLEKIRQAQQHLTDETAEVRKRAKLAAFGKVKWGEDALAYQKRLRDEWD